MKSPATLIGYHVLARSSAKNRTTATKRRLTMPDAHPNRTTPARPGTILHKSVLILLIMLCILIVSMVVVLPAASAHIVL